MRAPHDDGNGAIELGLGAMGGTTILMGLDEYDETIGRIEGQLRERAPSVPISNDFNFDRSAQKFVVLFPTGSFTLFVVKSAFERHSDERLLNLIGEIDLVPGETRILTDFVE